MSKPRAKRPVRRFVPACAPRAIVDQGFIGVRAKLIEVAAFLDRVERYGVKDDFRCAALRSAASLLVDGKTDRARRILEHLSDPTSDPEGSSSGKAALGAWLPPANSPVARQPRRNSKPKH